MSGDESCRGAFGGGRCRGAVGAEGPPSYVPVATTSSLRDMLPAAPPRPLADYVWFSAYRGENFI